MSYRPHMRHTDGLSGTKRATEQSIGHELLQPLAVQHVGLAPRYVLDVARIDQPHGEATRLQEFKQRDPVHTGGLHRHRVHATGRKPIGQRVQVRREAWEFTHRLVVPIRRHGHEMERTADIDACGVGVGDRQVSPSGAGNIPRLEGFTSQLLCETHPAHRNFKRPGPGQKRPGNDLRRPEVLGFGDRAVGL